MPQFDNIPFPRQLLYLLIALVLPLIIVYFLFSSTLSEISALKEQIYDLKIEAMQKERRQALNLALQSKHSDSDRFFVEKNLETINFLQPEVTLLEKVTANRNFAGDPKILSRLEFLKQENRLTFTESPAKTTPVFRETKLSQSRSVEINVEDLKNLLSIIEGVKIGTSEPPRKMPQFIILDFKLDRKEVQPQMEVYSLNLKLLKREFP